MPIIDKIKRAEKEYTEQLAVLRNSVNAQTLQTGFEKEMINILTHMLELRTEMEILEKVRKHQAGE